MQFLRCICGDYGIVTDVHDAQELLRHFEVVRDLGKHFRTFQ